MGIMKDWQLTLASIEEMYDVLREDEDVQELHLFGPVLRAAEAVLEAGTSRPPPHDVDVVNYALTGAYHELENLRKWWKERGIRHGCEFGE